MEENVIQTKSGITINSDVSVILLHENGKYLASIADDSVIMCDKITTNLQQIATITTVTTNFHEKKQPVKHKISVFYLHFY